MTERNWAWEAKKLLPHLAGMLGSGVTVQAGGGSMVAHALNSTTWHTGTLNESQAPWAITDTVYNAHVANVNAHHAKQHALSDAAAHSGSLPWAWLDKTGSSLGDLATRNYAQLNSRTHDIIGGDHSYTGGAALDVFGLSAASTLARLTPSADVSAGVAALLRSDAAGALTVATLTATTRVRSSLVDTAAGSLTLSPAGTAVLPTSSILKDLGDYNRKWRSLFAAELYVETLVAQGVLATIGGRIMVAPTTKLIADVSSGATTIDVEHNNLTSAYVYLASAPGGIAQVEVMKCGATATSISGGYRYTVTRNLDGSGANAWVSGDAVANIGAVAGQGWIELTSTNTALNHLGPTIAIYARTGTATWTDVNPVVALGNLRSFVDYAADQYGFALGNDLALTPATGFSGMTGDRTNGLRMFNTSIDLYSGASRLLRISQTDGIVFTSSSAYDLGRSIRFLGTDGNRLGALYSTGVLVSDNVGLSLVSDNNSATNPARISLVATNAHASGPRYVYVGTGGGVSIEIEKNSTYTAGRISFNTGISQFDGIAWFANGTADAPSIRFMNEAGMGLYRYAANTLGIAASGVPAAYINSGSFIGSGNIRATTSLHAGTFLAVDTTATFHAGAVVLDMYSGTYRGLSMQAFVGSTWAFGLTYRNAAGAMLGSWAAYGGADALSYLYSGVNYNDTTLRVYPATDRVGIGADVVPSYTLDVGGDVNATGTFRRNGYEGNILVFVPPYNLTDTGGAAWGNVTKAAGNYHFDVQLNGNGLPAATRGVLVWLSGQWSGANSSYYCGLYQYGSGTLVGNIRSYVGGIQMDAQISVPVDEYGRFTATVAGAVNMTGGYMRIIGYYI